MYWIFVFVYELTNHKAKRQICEMSEIKRQSRMEPLEFRVPTIKDAFFIIKNE
jgi:hypothetical protein